MAIAQTAVELARTLRSTAHLKTRQPLATAWIALPDRGRADRRRPARAHRRRDQRQAGRRHRRRVRARGTDASSRSCRRSASGSGRRSRRSWPPPGRATSTFEADGSVTLGGVTLAPDEVEIQATPRPGTAVAHHDGLVVVLDTALTPELVAEGDARELARAIQELRREAGLELDDRIDLWVGRRPGGRRGASRRRSPPTRWRRSPTASPRPASPQADGRARRRPGRDRASPPRRRSGVAAGEVRSRTIGDA